MKLTPEDLRLAASCGMTAKEARSAFDQANARYDDTGGPHHHGTREAMRRPGCDTAYIGRPKAPGDQW